MSKKNGKTEPKKFATFADFGEHVTEVAIKHPSGAVIYVKMRSVSDEEMRVMRRIFVPPPQPRLDDLKRNKETGIVEAPLAESGPKYDKWVEETELSQTNFSNLLLLRSLVDLEVPGDTELEKVDSLRTGKHVWASVQLMRAALELNSVSEEEVSVAVSNFP